MITTPLTKIYLLKVKCNSKGH